LGAGHTVTALYEVIPVGVRAKLSTVDELRYQSRNAKPDAFANEELMTVKLRYRSPNGMASQMFARSLMNENIEIGSASENTRFAAAVAEFGMLLRHSKLKGHSSFENCLALAKQSTGDDPEGYRSEFVSLIEKSAELMQAGQQARLER